MKAARYLAAFLHQKGVRRAFGHPGGEITEVIDGLHAQGIEFLLTHHEAIGGYLAGFTGELTGVPGLCLSTLGPGAANLAPALANALLDRQPVLAITAELDPGQRRTVIHQNLEIMELMRPVTKASLRLTADNLPSLLPFAFDLATAPRPGPVHLAFASSEASKEIEAPLPRERPLPQRTAPREAEVEAVRARLAAAHRPVVVAGAELNPAQAAGALLALVETLRAPVVVTPKAKGQIPEDHPLFVGTYGAYGDAAVQRLLRKADLILAAGLDGADLIRPWPPVGPVLALTSCQEADPTYPAEVRLVGELEPALLALAQGLHSSSSWSAQEIGELKREIQGALGDEAQGGKGLAPHTTLAILRKALPRDAILACDVGSHKLLACQYWPAYAPQSFLVSNGLSAMGTGLPAAIAAKLALPSRPVAAFVGDGGLLMYAAELATLARLACPLPAAVLVDESLSLIRIKQAQAACARVGVDFAGVDFATLGHSFGLPSELVGSVAELERALASALSRSTPSLICVATDPSEYTLLS